jgi:hypothetical protein
LREASHARCFMHPGWTPGMMEEAPAGAERQ